MHETVAVKTPLLTIFIPTYNRARALSHQLSSMLRANIGEMNDIEILVVNNKSTDHTAVVCERYVNLIKNLRFINVEVHLPCAEENINASISFWRGEYVWILGDDDIVNFETFRKALDLLRFGKHDYYLFNYCLEGSNNLVLDKPSEFFSCNIRQFVSFFGFFTVCACISITIFRSKYYKGFSDLIDVSAIYSHVVANLRSFKNCVLICR